MIMEKSTNTATMDRERETSTTRGRKEPRILIAGLGNLLLKDDGVGVQAVRELQKDPPAGVMIVEVGTAVLDAFHLFEWADRILAIDAMKAGGSPGTLYSLPAPGIEEHDPQVSLHEADLLAALRFLPEGKRPMVMILGVEPKVIDYGPDLSAKVESALSLVIHSVREIVSYWQEKPIHSDSAGFPDFTDEVGKRSGCPGAHCRRGLYSLLGGIVNNNALAPFYDALYHVAAHASETNHTQFHIHLLRRRFSLGTSTALVICVNTYNTMA